jgi:type I restriction enzyme S subunit
MSALVKSVAGRGFNEVKLEELVTYNSGKTLSTLEREQNEGEYPVMGGGMKYIGTLNKFNREGDNITVSKSGASAGIVMWHSNKFWAGDCFTIHVKNDTISLKYIYYYLKFNQHIIYDKLNRGMIPHCKWDDVNNIEIPLPPLEFQQDLVRRLEALDNQLKSLDDLAKSAEDNAKYMLESYLTPSISSQSEPVLQELVSEEVTEAPTVVEEVEKPKKKLIRKIKLVE